MNTPRVHAGQMVKARLKVHLPDNLRVPSNRPRDRNFTATVLAIDAPADITRQTGTEFANERAL